MKASLSFLIIILFCSIGWMETASSIVVPVSIRPTQNPHVTRIERSGLSEKVVEYSHQHPRARAREITAYANSLIKADGFDYEFDIGDFIERHGLKPLNVGVMTNTYDIQLEQTDNQSRAFRVSIEEGLCSESFLYLPAIEVTKSEFTAVLNGQPQRFKRPKDFYLDTMHEKQKRFVAGKCLNKPRRKEFLLMAKRCTCL